MFKDVKKYFWVSLLIVTIFITLGIKNDALGQEDEKKNEGKKVEEEEKSGGSGFGEEMKKQLKIRFAKKFVNIFIYYMDKLGITKIFYEYNNKRYYVLWEDVKIFLKEYLIKQYKKLEELADELIDLNYNMKDILEYFIKDIIEKGTINLKLIEELIKPNLDGILPNAPYFFTPFFTIFDMHLDIYDNYPYAKKKKEDIEKDKKKKREKNKKKLAGGKDIDKKLKELRGKIPKLLKKIQIKLKYLNELLFGGQNKRLKEFLKEAAKAQDIYFSISAWATGAAAGKAGIIFLSLWSALDFASITEGLGGPGGLLKKFAKLCGVDDVEALLKELEEKDKALARESIKRLLKLYNDLAKIRRQLKLLRSKRLRYIHKWFYFEFATREIKMLEDLKKEDSSAIDIKPLTSEEMKKKREAEKRREERREEEKKKKEIEKIEKKLAKEKYYYNKLKLIDKLFQLGKEYKKGVIPILIKLLKEEKNYNIKFYAAKKLNKLTGEDFGITHDNWLEWWKSESKE